jgi:hypothetical protein
MNPLKLVLLTLKILATFEAQTPAIPQMVLLSLIEAKHYEFLLLLSNNPMRLRKFVYMVSHLSLVLVPSILDIFHVPKSLHNLVVFFLNPIQNSFAILLTECVSLQYLSGVKLFFPLVQLLDIFV